MNNIKPKSSMTGPEAARIMGSIFRVRRDLVLLIKRQVMTGMAVTLEEADLLVDLHGAKNLGWPDPKAIEGGWVTFSALKESLVHVRELLTRRLQVLRKAGLVEVAAISRAEAKTLGVDSKSKKVRILPRGEDKAKEIYNRYGRACLEVMNRLPLGVRDQAETVLRFNEAVISALRWRI